MRQVPRFLDLLSRLPDRYQPTYIVERQKTSVERTFSTVEQMETDESQQLEMMEAFDDFLNGQM